jgi:hypothetical protein
MHPRELPQRQARSEALVVQAAPAEQQRPVPAVRVAPAALVEMAVTEATDSQLVINQVAPRVQTVV